MKTLLEMAAGARQGELAAALEGLGGLGREHRSVHAVLRWLQRGGPPMSPAQTPSTECRLETFRHLVGRGFFSSELMAELAESEDEEASAFMEALARCPLFDGTLSYYDKRTLSTVEETYDEFLAGKDRGRALVADAGRLLAEMEAPGFTGECLAGTGDAEAFIIECRAPGPSLVSPAQRAAQLGLPELAAEMLTRAGYSGCLPAGVLHKIAHEAMRKLLSAPSRPDSPYLALFAQVVGGLDADELAELLAEIICIVPNEPSQLVEVLVAAPQFGGYVWRAVDGPEGSVFERIQYRDFFERIQYRDFVELQGKPRLLEAWSEPR